MKTPNYSGTLFEGQHDHHQGDKLREAMLERRLADRDDCREIQVVTCPASASLKTRQGVGLLNLASKASNSDLTWVMHWAIQVGDEYFELQRDYYDPTRTGLRRTTWDEKQKQNIIGAYPQGKTAMSGEEIKEIGDSRFSRLNKMHINNYDIWANNCQIAVLDMLRDIGGLSHHQHKLKSLREWLRGFFCDSVLYITQTYYHYRGCDESVIER